MLFKRKKKVNTAAILSGIALTASFSTPLVSYASAQQLKDDPTGHLDAHSGEMKEVTLPSIPTYIPDISTNKNVTHLGEKGLNSVMANTEVFYQKDDYVFSLQMNHTLIAMDNKSGKILWAVPSVEGQELFAVDHIVIVHSGVEVAAYDIKTGTEKWHKEYQYSMSTPDEQKFMIRSVFSSDNHLYYLAAIGNVLENKNAVYEVDTKNGKTKMVYEAEGVAFSELRGIDKNSVKKSNKAVYYNPSFDLIRFANNGVQYSYILKPEKGFVVTFVPIETKVYLITRDYDNSQISHFYILDAASGKVLENYQIHDTIQQMIEGKGYIDMIGNSVYRLNL